MKETIIYTGHCIPYETLKSIVGFVYLRIKRQTETAVESGEQRGQIKDLNFITVTYGPPEMYTESIYTIRFTSYWATKILAFLTAHKLVQERPDGQAWIEKYSKEIYTGNPGYEYYNLKHFNELFKDALFQRAREVENTWLGKSLILFREDDIRVYDVVSKVKHIPFVLTDDEARLVKRKKDIEADLRFKEDINEQKHRKGIYGSGAWMDNPGDYWNID